MSRAVRTISKLEVNTAPLQDLKVAKGRERDGKRQFFHFIIEGKAGPGWDDKSSGHSVLVGRSICGILLSGAVDLHSFAPFSSSSVQIPGLTNIMHVFTQ